MRIVPLAVIVTVTAACASPSPVGAIRFAPQPPVWKVDDTAPLAADPEPRSFYRIFYKLDNTIARRGTRAMEAHPRVHAEDVNSLDEEPDSTWFTNRIGVRDLALDELRRGPNVDDSPFDHKPWTITGAKIGGRELGFIFTDSAKRKFLLKFDPASLPEAETAAHVIVHRILWACGYNVPEDFLGYIARGDLVIGDEARAKGLDEGKLDAALQSVYHAPDGTIRALASLFIAGKILGPYAREGVRKDDANDRVRHERRRSLRGQYPIFAWLDHTDMKEDNTVDAFADGHITHYLIDFGKSLGVQGVSDQNASNGYRYLYDVPEALADLFTLGLRAHPWDDVVAPGLSGVALFDSAHFDPAGWHPNQPYWPFTDADRFDAFWGAKLMMRFKPHELAAIVAEAQLSDPRAARYLVDALLYRQRATGRYWFDRVAPLDDFAVTANGTAADLCFTDLALFYLLRASATTYAVDTYDRGGAPTGFAGTVVAGARGKTCTRVPLAGAYTIVRLRVRRDGRELPPVVVHVAPDASGALTVIGLRRR